MAETENCEHSKPVSVECGVIRAFRVKAHGTEAIVFAASASKARYGCYLGANDAGYRTTFADISVKRAPEFDCREDTNGKIPRTGLCLGAEYLKRV